jgi:hypothetical protein
LGLLRWTAPPTWRRSHGPHRRNTPAIARELRVKGVRGGLVPSRGQGSARGVRMRGRGSTRGGARTPEARRFPLRKHGGVFPREGRDGYLPQEGAKQMLALPPNGSFPTGDTPRCTWRLRPRQSKRLGRTPVDPRDGFSVGLLASAKRRSHGVHPSEEGVRCTPIQKDPPARADARQRGRTSRVSARTPRTCKLVRWGRDATRGKAAAAPVSSRVGAPSWGRSGVDVPS